MTDRVSKGARSGCARIPCILRTGSLQASQGFNESMVVLMTEGGGLTVEGTELHITKLNLDEGQVIIEGQIIAFEYDDVPVQRGSFFSRMFR